MGRLDDLFGWIGQWNRRLEEKEEEVRVKCDFCGHVYYKSRGNCPMCNRRHFDSLEELDEYYLNEPRRRRRGLPTWSDGR